MIYWEDVTVGESMSLGSRLVGATEIVAFARQYDPQVFHLDAEAAQRTLLRGLAASGWHSCALLNRLLHESLLRRANYLGMPRIDAIRWLAPVRPQEMLLGRLKWLGKRIVSDRPHLGVCQAEIEGLDDRHHAAMKWQAHLVFRRRSSARPDEASSAISWSELFAPGRAARATRVVGDETVKYFDEVVPGEELALGSHRFTADGIAAFNARFDPHPLCITEDGPLSSEPAPGVASGWHVAAAWMRCIVNYHQREGVRLRASGYAVPELGPSPGMMHLQWWRPVIAGDTVTFRGWAERKVELTNHFRWGLLMAGAEGINQRGELVVSFYPQFLLERRLPGATPDTVRRYG